MCFSTQKAFTIIPPLSNIHNIYFIAEDIYLIAYIQCDIERKNALRGTVLDITKMDTSLPEKDLNIISCLSKACWR